jgi:hypothetical protein
MNIDINDAKSELGEEVYWSADQEIICRMHILINLYLFRIRC